MLPGGVGISVICLISFGIGLSEATVKCGTQSMTDSVWDGAADYVRPHQYPWTVFLQNMYEPFLEGLPYLFTMCDGVLVDDQWVLTAANCFHQKPGYILHKVAVVLGAHNLTDGNETGKVAMLGKKVYRHPLYDDTSSQSKHDLALMLLSHRLDLEYAHKYIVPICLPSVGHVAYNSGCQTVGWGKSEQFAKLSSVLQKKSVSVLTSGQCYRYRREVDDSQLCATDSIISGGLCDADAGGPLQCRAEDGSYVVEGIVSYGQKSCLGTTANSKPTVFTNVAKYRSWIDQTRLDLATTSTEAFWG